MEKIVQTKYGKVEGFEENGLVKFLGIPYARQPRGELRWKRAQECEPWEGILAAKEYGPVARWPGRTIMRSNRGVMTA